MAVVWIIFFIYNYFLKLAYATFVNKNHTFFFFSGSSPSTIYLKKSCYFSYIFFQNPNLLFIITSPPIILYFWSPLHKFTRGEVYVLAFQYFSSNSLLHSNPIPLRRLSKSSQTSALLHSQVSVCYHLTYQQQVTELTRTTSLEALATTLPAFLLPHQLIRSASWTYSAGVVQGAMLGTFHFSISGLSFP